jgi:asparagine synthase (glutamine-hydrolysing)
MCGISGIINKNNKRVSLDEIKKINDLIKHRGPDDEGFYFGRNFAFGHRRLAIIDLSKNAHQPMEYKGKYVITYNGEIYNYLEIKEELLKDGYKFNSNSDTEVILASYDKWGEECVKKFNGMWAFAIYDKERDIIFCSRDRFGIKPFYYTEIDDKFVFGSEIKQLLEFFDKKYVNIEIMLDYLIYGLEEHTNKTFFKKIYKLKQSHNLIYNLKKHTFEIKPYYSLEINRKLNELNESESIKFLKEKLKHAINLRLRSDVKVGTCLSGGLDSSSIAAIASIKYFENTNNKFTAVHAKSVENKTDESEFAKEVADYCNLNLIIVEPKLEEIANIIKEVIYTQEEPFGGPSIIMQYFVMKKAKEVGCKVMLDGQGGDETLFGYESYFSYYFAWLLSKFKLIKYIEELKSIKPFKISKKRIVRNSVIFLIRDKLLFLENFMRKKRTFLKINYNRKKLKYFFEMLDFKNFQIREIMIKNLPHLLRYEDKNSMRHSVETRLPFVDYQFVESAVSINDELKIKKGYLKFILRKIVEDILPENVVWRTNKFGFEAPTDMWINKYKDEMIEVIKKSKIINEIVKLNKEVYSNKDLLWKMYNIAVWENIYGVEIERT